MGIGVSARTGIAGNEEESRAGIAESETNGQYVAA
jgi:hypothetical protein